MADVVVAMSEFGRTVRENGNHGTDNGHGNAMLIMGGGVKHLGATDLSRVFPDHAYNGPIGFI